MTAEQALAWLERDVGEKTADSPATNVEALLRALPLEDGEDGAGRLLASVSLSVAMVEGSEVNAIAKAFIFGARLARHAADLESLGARA